MFTFQALKLGLSAFYEFIAKYWRVILCVLIAVVIFHYKTAYERTVQELALFKADIAKTTALKQVEDRTKRTQADKSVAAAAEKHQKEIEGIKNEYERLNKINGITIADLRNRLRTEISNSITLPSFTPDSGSTTEEWKNSYAAISGQYQTLKEACTITTIDYNALRTWADSACDQVGCN